MIFSFLDDKNIFERYQAAKKYTDTLTVPFPEFERIADNKPFEGIDPAYPNTTDGTTASIIRKTPRRVIQQLPTGQVVTDDEGWLGIVADFILTNKILPYANEEYDLIQKCWVAVENALTFGSCAVYTPFLNHDGYFCPDMTTLYWGDVAIQPGKKSISSCNYFFMRSWWQKEDIDALIDKETKLAASSKKRGEKYESTWDIEALKELKDSGETTKDQQARTPVENDRGLDARGIEIVTGFQKGVGAKFYTFASSAKKIVRTEENKDPRGKYPIDVMYGDVDGTNPLGRGIVELVGPLQNLIDTDMQMYQFNRALMLAPPVVVTGNISKSQVSLTPNAVMKITDPNGKIVPLTIDTTAVANYPQLYGLQKSQLLNLVNSPDTSISSDVGNPNFSKTTAGVNAQQAVVSVDDNYVRKMFESLFQHWAETAVNLYFAKRSGVDELQLDKDTAMRLRELPNFDQSILSPDNMIRIDYDTDTPALKFRVNPSTSTVKDQAAQVQDATSLLDLVMKYPMLNSSYGGPIDTEVLARRIVANSGIEDPEQVAPEPTEAQKQAKEQSKNNPNPFSPMFDKPSIRMNFPDLPPAAQVQVLANAGVQVSIQDVMQGPVADPNIRGVFNPVSDPNMLTPGQNPGQAMTDQTNPIDLGDIYKQTTDPAVKAQIEKMAGLQPDVQHVANQMTVSDAQAQTAAQPQPAPQNAQPTEPPLVSHLKQLGLSDNAVQQVVSHTLKHAGGNSGR